MPAEEQPTARPRSRSSSDSVDLAEFLSAKQHRPPGWLDAVSRVVAPQANASTTLTSTNANNTTLVTTRGGGSTPGEYTPATSRYPAEVTAMGSPIPVDTDDSDANIHHLISRLGVRGEALLSPAVSGDAALPAPARLQHNNTSPTPPPSPACAGAIPQATSPPSPRPIAHVHAPHPATHSGGGGRVGTMFAGGAAPSSHASSQPLQPNAADAFQHSPFGGSHNITGSTEHTTWTQQHSDFNPNATTATDTLQHLTTYSSALMQALSRTEGAAVLTSQWISTVHPSRTYSDDDDEGDSARSSAYPPDIYEEAMRAKVAKQQWMALERARQEVLEEARRRRDCPFAPQVSPYAARMCRPTSLRPENRVQSEVIRRKQWMAKKQQQEVERELRECTFRPLTVRAAQLDPASRVPTGPAVFQHLYAEAEDRRTFEAEVKPLLVQQAEGRSQPSPMRPAQLAGVVERLCARGVVRTSETVASREGGTEDEATVGGPYAARSVDAAATATVTTATPSRTPVDVRPPLLSSVSQRIVAAQVASGERDPDVVRHLYRQAERDAMRDQLKMELAEEKERVARAEQAMVLAQDRRRLQQEYYRSVLIAKYRALSKHACDTQRTSYRATAPQSVALLGRASFDVLSMDETEELLSAVENCGQHKLREAEFVAVIFRYFAESHVAPANAALLSRPPPAFSVVGSGAANAKRASSAPRSGGGGSSLDGSPPSLPKIKREKPDLELIAHIRESRAQALEEWKKEHQRQRAIADGIVADDDHSFQPAPRRLIPFECRPDVVVPVKTTRSEALRRAHIVSRQQDGNAAAAPPQAATMAAVSSARTPATEQASTARELFSRLAASEGVRSQSGRPLGGASRGRSHSGAAAPGPSPREGSAAASSVSPAPQRQSRAASAGTRGPSQSPPRVSKAALLTSSIPSRSVTPAGYRASVPQPRSVQTQPRWPPASPQPAAPVSAAQRETVGHAAKVKPAKALSRARSTLPSTSVSLVEQIMHSTPEERARLGRELLLRQLREHQRRQSS